MENKKVESKNLVNLAALVSAYETIVEDSKGLGYTKLEEIIFLNKE